MADPSVTDAISLETQDVSKMLCIKDVHIGVFFDGTNNNMVQQAYFHTYKSAKGKKEVEPITDGYEKWESLQKKRDTLEADINYALNQAGHMADAGRDSEVAHYIEESEEKKKELQLIEESIEKLQVEAHIDTYAMASDEKNGYSNIAILHSLLNTQENTDETKFYNLYIEGSGANDIVTSRGSTSFLAEGNTNGLGFGVGLTGVTALVSKAVKYIYNYLSPLVIHLNENTNYHFYVFGFSRGATCARLFTQLAAREENSEKLECEKEFTHDTSKVKGLVDKKSGRLPFMESHFLTNNASGAGVIKRSNVKVEFLGIYDTVASIGLLQQKDGWINGLKASYDKVFPQYRNIYHFQNAAHYGLFIPQTAGMGHTCHICAADEFRENFALVNIGNELPANASEIVIPGCHSDVGGGYVTEIGKERVLYKFTPRKTTQKDKNGNEKVLSSIFAKRNISDEAYNTLKKATMFIDSPYECPSVKNIDTLSGKSLNTLGWIDENWNDRKKRLCTDTMLKNPCTIRLADSETDKCVKFKRHVIGGYSNIPLSMMIKYIQRLQLNIQLFPETTTPYDIPNELTVLGNDILKHVNPGSSQRLWVIPKGGYGGVLYRLLRLKYLHFTASSQLINWRMDWKIFETDWANFGNECNYDENATICRIMYNGEKECPSTSIEGIHYMYDMSNLSTPIKPIIVDSKRPLLYNLS